MKKLRMRKESLEVKITIIVFFALFIFCAVWNLSAAGYAILNSLKTATDYFDNGDFALPKTVQFINYVKIFSVFEVNGYTYLSMFWNSMWMLVLHVFCNVLSSTLLAYPLAKFRFPGKEFLYALVIFTNTIPIIGSGATEFKVMFELGMVDNPSLIWFSWCCGFDFAFIVFYGAFKGVSDTYSEAARIDGANNIQVFLTIILPQVVPCIVAISITQAMSVWNNYAISMIYLRSYPTLAYGLYLFHSANFLIEDSIPIYFAAAVVSAIPVIILYSCSQKLLLTNVTAGGLKG